MCRLLRARAIPLASLIALLSACGSPDESPRPLTTVTRPAGSWQGSGSTTIGFVSESGRFRVTWEARDEHPPAKGIFRLTVHSAVSGRPIQVVADQSGDGRGTAQVEDDPRPYNLMVEATNAQWSISVEEVLVTDAAPSPPSSRR